MSTDSSGGFSQQFPVFNIPTSRDGFYVTPYSSKLKIFTGANFTLDQRDKIYLKDNSSGINYIILFYKEMSSQSSEIKAYLNSIQNLFIKISSVSIENVEFRICNLTSDELLNKAFEEVKNNSTHPFNWIRSAKNPDIYILIYSSGYPQMFYEGPLNETSLTQFANNLSDKGVSDNLYKKYGVINGFFDARGVGETYREQAWRDFKNNPISFGNLPSNLLIKDEKLQDISGLKLGIKVSQYSVPSFINLPKNPKMLYNNLRDKIREKQKNDNFKIKSMLGNGENYLINEQKDGSGLLSKAVDESPYKQYFLPFNISKEEEQKKKMSVDAEYIYKISKKLYGLKSAYNLTDKQVAELAVNMYGLYKFNQYSIATKASTKADVVNLFLTENIIPTYALGVSPAFYENIASNVADEIKGENVKIIKNIMDYFNKDKDGNNLKDKDEKVFKITEDDADNLLAIVKDEYDLIEKDKKNDQTYWEIESDKLPSSLTNYYENKTNENNNEDINNLVSKSNGTAMKNLFKMVINKEQAFNLKNVSKPSGGGGNVPALSSSGGGRRGRDLLL